MGTMQFLKGKLTEAAGQAWEVADQARGRVGSFAAEHSSTAGGAIDKAASFVNARTEGKYADKVVRVGEFARKGLDLVAEQAKSSPWAGGGTPMRGGAGGDGTPMSGPRR